MALHQKVASLLNPESVDVTKSFPAQSKYNKLQRLSKGSIREFALKGQHKGFKGL
jgi:hypothetical protein